MGVTRLKSFRHQFGSHVPSPNPNPIFRNHESPVLHRIGFLSYHFLRQGGRRQALQLKHRTTAVLSLVSKNLIVRGIQIINSFSHYIRGCFVHILPIIAHHIGMGMQERQPPTSDVPNRQPATVRESKSSASFKSLSICS